jgi:tripartite-type tricarboxylate transporter receptor subunit TctC
MMTRTSILTALCLIGATAAQAQTYPSKTITMVVTAAPGGVTDVVARGIGQRLAKDWNTQVVIENKGGGAHIIGAQEVAKAAPDGYTLLVAEAGTFVLNPTLYAKKLSYDPEKDIAPITGLVRINQALIADNGLAANNVKELLALAKKKPGEITYGTAGVGSAPHMNILKLQNMAHIQLQAIHYRGAAPALSDIIAGHINLMSVSISLVVQPAKAKKLKILGVGSAQRVAQLPDVPTVSESGVPGYEARTWFGLAAPGATPRPIIEKINAEVQKILKDPDFEKTFMAPQMFEPMTGSPEEFSKYIQSEIKSWSTVIKEQKLVIQ